MLDVLLFIPHGHCYLWKLSLVRLHLVSDALIAIAYYSIPFTLFHFVRKRKDIPFPKIFLLFGAFIILCGTTHLMAIWTLWHPSYWLSGTIKALAATVSVYTAIALVPVIPIALNLPNPTQLKRINDRLEQEVADRLQTEEDLRQLSDRLQERTQFLQTVLDTFPLSVFWKDRDSVYLGCNQNFLRDAGLASVADIIGKTDDQMCWGPTHAEAYRADDRAVVESGQAKLETIETRIAGDGTQIWLETNKIPLQNLEGETIGILGTYQDITDRIETDRAMKRQLAAIEAAIDGIAILQGDRYLYTNLAHVKLFGYEQQEELIGKSWKILYSSEELERFDREVFPVLERDGAWQGEATATRKDGSTFAEGLSLTISEDGLLICVGQDITLRKQAEKQIQNYANQLEISNRELEAFAYSVSHDLRTPLRAIDGFSQALLEDYGDTFDEEGRYYFDRIRKNATRMGTLIDDLLSLSQVSRTEVRYTTVNLSALAREAIEQLQVSAPQRQVEAIIAPEVIIEADATLMRVVLTNLLDNAWKFTSHHPTARIEFGISTQGEEPTYFVRDDGAGFDMAYTKMLFGVFQRLHDTNEFPGTGIGLASVQRAIHRHWGRIWAQGAIEEGATFYFTLPSIFV